MTDDFVSNSQVQHNHQIDWINDLYSYLYSHRDDAGNFDHSRENLDNLIKLYDRRNMIPFIGNISRIYFQLDTISEFI